jgi:hypothetical protein
MMAESRQPTEEELIEFAQWAQTLQPQALEKIKTHGFVFDDLDDPWQKLAFTLYSTICQVKDKAQGLFEEE